MVGADRPQPPNSGAAAPNRTASPCQACGACCAYAGDWPRFSTESEAELDRIPADLVAPSLGGMRWLGDRCAALDGVVGTATACRIYADRPHVCRACEPGDDACTMARERRGLAPLEMGDPDR